MVYLILIPNGLSNSKSSFNVFCNVFINIVCVYVYNDSIISLSILFHHFLGLHNHTKTHTLIFYLILVLKVLNGQVYS